MSLTVNSNVKEELLINGTDAFVISTSKVSLINSSGTVVGVLQGTSNDIGLLGWYGDALDAGDDLVQDDPIVFELESGDNVAGFKLYDFSGSNLALTYQFETVYNYTTAGTFTISGARATIN